ncbi:MAG TPA: hypothetical protein VGH76_01750 [Actinomycetospora sp.]|uniref:helix-turn-helix domain-containing protein n=1 Tax=Actinomycetospora sp. TaxID=1872135 RepID=UPI002F40380E
MAERDRTGDQDRIEALTDDLAAPTYDSLEPDEIDQLVADLEPIAAALHAGGMPQL